MQKKTLRSWVHAHDQFIVVAEFVPLPGHKLNNFEKFLNDYEQKKSQLEQKLKKLELVDFLGKYTQ